MIERVIVAGGGTGGHLFPGIAVVEELRRREPELSVLFVGTGRGIEARVLPRLGERLEQIEVHPIKGRRPLQLARGVAVLPAAAARCAGIIRRERPDLVLGVGGYASGPMLAAAAAMGVPTAVLEQNAHVGLTNRWLARVVGRAYVTFPETAATFSPDRVRVSGNPVRRAFVDAARRAMADPTGFEARSRQVLVLGGSQGARSLNVHVPQALAEAGVTERGFEVIHQSGGPMHDEVAARYEGLGVRAQVVPFIEDMARAYAQAAVVIARAGATTVAELCAVGRPSILIPYPYAANDHQRKNAEALQGAGAAVSIADDALSSQGLGQVLGRLLDDPARRRHMAEAARGLGRPDAAAAIVDDLCEWLGCRLRPDRDEDQARSADASAAMGEADEGEGSGVGARGTEAGEQLPVRGRRPYVPRAVPSSFPPRRDAACPRIARRPLVAHPSLLE